MSPALDLRSLGFRLFTIWYREESVQCIRHQPRLERQSILAGPPNLNICDKIIELCVTLLLVYSYWLTRSRPPSWLVVVLMAPGNKNQTQTPHGSWRSCSVLVCDSVTYNLLFQDVEIHISTPPFHMHHTGQDPCPEKILRYWCPIEWGVDCRVLYHLTQSIQTGLSTQHVTVEALVKSLILYLVLTANKTEH